MKKVTLILACIAVLGTFKAKAISFSNPTEEVNSSYVVNDQAVESMFANSTDISSEFILQPENASVFANTDAKASFKDARGGKSAIVAILIDLLVGGLGIHRIYLGTATFTWIGYILTCGGIFGLLPFIDLIVLCINAGDISKYEDNSKFFMW